LLCAALPPVLVRQPQTDAHAEHHQHHRHFPFHFSLPRFYSFVETYLCFYFRISEKCGEKKQR
jgi:hypothetical protein